jgi:hypothetical protein
MIRLIIDKCTKRWIILLFSLFHSNRKERSNDGVGGLRRDSAHIVFVATDVDEAFVTPLLSPAVLHEPIIFAFGSPVPGKKERWIGFLKMVAH